MKNFLLDQLRDIIQHDIANRGLRTDPERNLINTTVDDFRLACHSLADHPQPRLAVVTGFFIPTANPPAAETDGPLGALFLARAFFSLGISVVLATDENCVPALLAVATASGLCRVIRPVTLPTTEQAKSMSESEYWNYFQARAGDMPITHLLAIERVGPSHTHDAVPPEHRDRCHTMRGRDITELTSPAHRLFEAAHRQQHLQTIGIGDGGNEIGMGKIPWDVIRRNIPNGEIVACRIPTHHLIVCGVSNWGAYALAAGVGILRGQPVNPYLFDPIREQHVLEAMVREGGLVDGVLGKPSATVDGLSWEQYAEVLAKIGGVN